MSSTIASRPDYRVADLSLAPFGRKEIHLAEHEIDRRHPPFLPSAAGPGQRFCLPDPGKSAQFH